MSTGQESKPKRLRVAMLVKSQATMRQTAAYLYRRGVDAVFSKTLKELIQQMTDSIKEGKKFSAVYVSVNFPHQRIDTIPGLIEQSFAVPSIVFSEESDRRSTAKLSAVQAPNVVYGALSGPAAYLRLQNILKKDEMAASMKRQQQAAAAGKDNDDKIKVKENKDKQREKEKAETRLGKSEAEKADNEKNRMVYIKHDKAEPKGKSFYHFKKEEPPPTDVADDEAYQALLAEADQGGSADSTGSIDSSATATAGTSDELSALLEKPAATDPGGDASYEGFGGDGDGVTSSDSDGSGSRSKKTFGKSKRRKSAQDSEEKPETEADIFRDSPASNGSESAEAEDAPDYEGFLGEGSDGVSGSAKGRTGKNKGKAKSKDRGPESEGAESDFIDSGSDASYEGFDPNSGEERSKHRRPSVARDRKAEDGAGSRDVAENESTGSDAENSNDIFAESTAPPLNDPRLSDPVFAASAKQQEALSQGESYSFNSDPAKSQADDLHATVEHVSFHHPTARDERMFDDVIKRCARATLQKMKANVADMPLGKRTHNEGKVISIKAKNIAGTIFISTGRIGKDGTDLLSKAVDIFLEKAVERGINSNVAEILVCGLDDAQAVMNDIEETNFSMCGQTPDFHIMISFIHGMDLFPKLSVPEAGHYSLAVNDLSGEKVNFDVFLRLSLNNKFIRYLKPGLILEPKQVEKLKKYLIETLYVHEKDMQELKEFKVVKNLKSSKKKAA